MPPKKERAFDAQAFLESAGLGKRIVSYARKDVIFSQGDPSDSVMYVRTGGIQLSVLSHTGREAIVATKPRSPPWRAPWRLSLCDR
jgi:CRP/FNR family cyclic AMP-dependent transcriptional regulator